MKAMILAAGRGERMRPLTDHTPKPLLKVGGKPLIIHHIENLKNAGFSELVINHAHLGEQIVSALGDGSEWGVSIDYSAEEKALETGGGIFKALPLLTGDSFLVVNGDVWCDFDFAKLSGMVPQGDAHLVMIDNPPHNPNGDFALTNGSLADSNQGKRLTFSGIGVYTPSFFANCSHGAFPLAPILRESMGKQRITGEYHRGNWIDVGTPERLMELDKQLSK